jgi:hypothetical protein
MVAEPSSATSATQLFEIDQQSYRMGVRAPAHALASRCGSIWPVSDQAMRSSLSSVITRARQIIRVFFHFTCSGADMVRVHGFDIVNGRPVPNANVGKYDAKTVQPILARENTACA